MRMLETYDWPGNVRELENVLQRAIILSHGTTLSLSEAWLPAREPMPIGEGVTLLEVERRHIVHVLNASCWRIEGSGGAAAALGMKPAPAQPHGQARRRQASQGELVESLLLECP